MRLTLAAVRGLLAACALSGTLLGPPGSCPPAWAASDGSPVASEVLNLVDKYYLDRSFNGVDFKAARERIQAKGPLSDEQALRESQKFVKAVGDKYSKVLAPDVATMLSKYDVTGVGMNLVIADNGNVEVGAVPPAESDAAKLGVGFGDVVLSINGRDAKGMTSFDALEAIQSDPAGEIVRMELRPAGSGVPKQVELRKSFIVSNPVSYSLAKAADGRRVGYIRLREFNAQCKPRVREAMAALQEQGAERLVLDLRGNGGGVLDGALGIAGMFMQKPLVLYVTDAKGALQVGAGADRKSLGTRPPPSPPPTPPLTSCTYLHRTSALSGTILILPQPLYSREVGPVAAQPLEIWVD